MTATTRHKTCNLCEATCGLLIDVDVEANRVLEIRPDKDDPFSRGDICPKAFMLKEVQEDPDRLRHPVRRTPGGAWERISWDAALDLVATRTAEIQRRHGKDAVALYWGNPTGHNIGIALYVQLLMALLGSKNRYSSSSVDQQPKLAACWFLFGNIASIPVPDIDRARYMLVLGANPLVSNGSVMTAPDVRARLRAVQARGGKIVVVDPRRTETARIADEHHFIRPGADALFLAAIVDAILGEGLARVESYGARVSAADLEWLGRAVAPFRAEAVAPAVGIDAPTIRRIARELSAPEAICYGRIGTCLNEFGTLASWLCDVVHVITGNLDRPGGAMFTSPAADLRAVARRTGLSGHHGKWRSRVRGAPEFNDELPSVCLAEEMLTPGPGQVRGFITVAGNPVLSTPNGGQLDRALGSLEFCAAVDLYVNETTRHAHVILPPTWSLEHEGYEAIFHMVAVRNTAKYSPPVLRPEGDVRDDWRILSDLALRIAERRGGVVARTVLGLVRRLGAVPSPRRVLDLLLRLGPYGRSHGLSVRALERSPKGVDLGPLRPALGEAIATRSGRIELEHPLIVEEIARLRARSAAPPPPAAGGLVLIGRRDVRTNNSWGHNAPLMVKGRPRCTLLVNPRDAARLGLADGEEARVTSRVGSIVAPVEVTDEIMPGVVSLPHGWGHGRPGAILRTAATQPGVSVNDVTDDELTEGIVANAVTNGVPVVVEPVRGEKRAAVAQAEGAGDSRRTAG